MCTETAGRRPPCLQVTEADGIVEPHQESPWTPLRLLKNDHRTVEQLFTRYEATTDRADKTRRELVDEIIRELSIHAAIEEQVFYPAVRLAVPDAEDEVLEGLEEHHIVKWTLSELQSLDPDAERFHAKVTVLMESVRHHVEDEEGEMFPKVRDAVSAPPNSTSSATGSTQRRRVPRPARIPGRRHAARQPGGRRGRRGRRRGARRRPRSDRVRP